MFMGSIAWLGRSVLCSQNGFVSEVAWCVECGERGGGERITDCSLEDQRVPRFPCTFYGSS